MENDRIKLKIASAINIIIGVIGSFYVTYSAFLCILGVIIFIISNKEDLKKYKTPILVLAIFSIFINLISCILLFITYGNITDEERKTNRENAPPRRVIKKLNPELRKIDILLKLGVGMVLVAGILFATTSWTFVSDFLKAFSLLLLGGLFLGLSLVTEKKFKLYHSSCIYWLGSMAFFLLTIIGILFLGVTGNNLTYTGSASPLAIAITFAVLFGLSYATYLKYSKEDILYVVYSSILLTIVFVLKYVKIPNEIIIIIISTISLLTTMFAKKSTVLYQFNTLVSLIIPIYIIGNINQQNFLYSISGVINIGIHYYLTYNDDTKEESIIHLLFVYGLWIASVYNLGLAVEVLSLVIMIGITVIITLMRILEAETHNIINYCLYAAMSLILYVINIDSNIACMIAIVFLLENVFLIKTTGEMKQYVKYVLPLSIIMICYSILNLDFIPIEPSTNLVFAISAIALAIIYYVIKEESDKFIYMLAIIVLTLIFQYRNTVEKETLSAILFLLPTGYLFYANKNQEIQRNLVSYGLFLLSVYHVIVKLNVLDINNILATVLFLWLLMVLIAVGTQKERRTLNFFAIVIPLFHILSLIKVDSVYKQLVFCTILLYLTFLAVRFICKNKDNKDVVGTLGIIFSLQFIIFISNYLIGIYVGLVGIGVIFLGYYKKELKYFFPLGIGITILNIIIQLKEVWTKIPFWLYLLVTGLSIIGFVTYKEWKKTKK